VSATGEAGAEPAIILGRNIPMPEAPLVATRVWRPIQTVVKALNAQEAFMIWMKAGFVVGMVISSPYVFLQIWNFVAAGLYHHERKYVHIYLPFSLVLFLAGAATAFFFVFKYVLQFLFGFNAAMQIDPDPRISEWLGFVLLLPLAFGVAFQLPLVMLFLHRIGIVSLEAYLSKWRMAIMIIFVASMLLTPADPVSMLLMAIPMTGLYFLGIGLCRWMPRNKTPFAEGYEP
jgi:sec-independent protein translocase protein TatC